MVHFTLNIMKHLLLLLVYDIVYTLRVVNSILNVDHLFITCPGDKWRMRLEHKKLKHATSVRLTNTRWPPISIICKKCNCYSIKRKLNARFNRPLSAAAD